jgi:uncharacterized protein (TIGR00369 family)
LGTFLACALLFTAQPRNAIKYGLCNNVKIIPRTNKERLMSIEKAMKEIAEIKEKFETEYGMTMDLPPRSFMEMGGEFIEIEDNRKIKVRFPYDDRFANPIGIFQGGMLCAAIDNTFGPLSYLALKRPSVTLDLSTQFVRPFSPKDEFIDVEAKVVSISSATLLMQAEVRNPKNKLVATATTTFLILQDNMLARMSSNQKEE